MAEQWVLIHDGYYEVSDLGSVRRAKPGIATFVGRPVMPIVGSTGYATVGLSGGTSRRAYIHHLVAEAFHGKRPDGFVINHKDADKSNNAAVNLEYVSRQENAAHAVRVVTRRKGPTKPKAPKIGPQTGDMHWSHRTPEKVARGARMPHSKLTPGLVRDARRRVAAGEKQSILAAELGICVAQMSRIILNKRWTYV